MRRICDKNGAPMIENQPFLFGFLRRRSCVTPTWRGWCALLLLCAVTATAAVRGAYAFLAVNDPMPGGVLVAEGWGNDDFKASVMAEFKRNHYDGLFVTGGPIENGAPLSEYKTWGELGAATLERMGVNPKVLHAVPAPPVRQDRTYASAMALKKWLREHGIAAAKINVMSVGAHSRRTRLLFEKAFGADAKVGIIATEEQTFNSRRWWTSSQGFREVTDEMAAYFYARFLFHAPRG